MNQHQNAPELADVLERVQAGHFVFRAGEAGEYMYIVQEGEVEILAPGEPDPVRLALFSEGDFFGEMAVLEELPRTASARAVTDCALLRIDRETFDQLIRHNPEIAVRMLRKLCQRLRAAHTQLPEAPPEPPPTPEPREPVAPAAAPYLLHEPTGTRYVLAPSETNTVGRKDPVTGLTPTVDLGSIDTKKTTSRRHAAIFFRGDGWYVREEVGVANGTFVNGKRLTPGEPHPLVPGDLVRFGLVELAFHPS